LGRGCIRAQIEEQRHIHAELEGDRLLQARWVHSFQSKVVQFKFALAVEQVELLAVFETLALLEGVDDLFLKGLLDAALHKVLGFHLGLVLGLRHRLRLGLGHRDRLRSKAHSLSFHV